VKGGKLSGVEKAEEGSDGGDRSGISGIRVITWMHSTEVLMLIV
jgi:hypothetical protein